MERKKLIIIISIIVAVLVVVISSFIILFINKKDNTTSNQESSNQESSINQVRKQVSVDYNVDILEYNFDENNKTAVVTGIKDSISSDEEQNIKKVVIPDVVIKDKNNYKVTSMKACIFFDLENLTDVSIPSEFELPESAFKKCTSLKNIIIPYGVTKIPQYCFAYCSNLSEVNLPDSVTEIGISAFTNCTALKKVRLPENLEVIGDNLFEACKNLDSINIPNSVTKICNSAFAWCSKLEKVQLPDSVAQIGNSCFRNCSSLTEIVIPENVQKMGLRVFEKCNDNLTITVKGKYKIPEKGWEKSWNFLDERGKTKAKTNWEGRSNNGTSEDNTKTFEEKKVDKISDVTWEYNNIDFKNLKWLNTEKYGNICIPSNWELYKDVQTLDETVIAYGLPDSSQSIVIRDCISGVAKDEIESLLSKLSADSQLEEWSREIITIKNKTGVVINAKFKGINHIQSTLFIASADQKRLIIVMVEAPDPNVRNLLNTFTLDKIEKDAVTYFESTKK